MTQLRTPRFLMAAFALLLLGAGTAYTADDKIVAERGRDQITVSQARAMLASLDPDARKKLAAGNGLPDLLRSLLLQRAILQEAQAQKWQDRPEIAALLQRAHDQALSQSFLAAQANIPADYPSEADIQAAYEQNKPKLMRPRGYHLAEIYLPGTAADQPGLRRRLADLARKHGGLAEAAKSQKLTIADLGWIEENQLQPSVKSAVAGLPENALADPVCLPAGCHLLQLVATRPAGPAPLAQVRDALVRALRQQKEESGERAYANGLLTRQPVRINEIALSEVTK